MISQGFFWIEPDSGRVLKSVLTTHDMRVNLYANIEVDYRPDARLGVWLPAEMREIYQHGRRHTVRANASYRNYRRFDVYIRVIG